MPKCHKGIIVHLGSSHVIFYTEECMCTQSFVCSLAIPFTCTRQLLASQERCPAIATSNLAQATRCCKPRWVPNPCHIIDQPGPSNKMLQAKKVAQAMSHDDTTWPKHPCQPLANNYMVHSLCLIHARDCRSGKAKGKDTKQRLKAQGFSAALGW